MLIRYEDYLKDRAFNIASLWTKINDAFASEEEDDAAFASLIAIFSFLKLLLSKME